MSLSTMKTGRLFISGKLFNQKRKRLQSRHIRQIIYPTIIELKNINLRVETVMVLSNVRVGKVCGFDSTFTRLKKAILDFQTIMRLGQVCSEPRGIAKT